MTLEQFFLILAVLNQVLATIFKVLLTTDKSSGARYPVFSPTGDAGSNNGKVYIIQGGQFYGAFN